MDNNLNLTLDCENFSVEGPTLRMFLETYGIYDSCTMDISIIESEIKELTTLKEKYLRMKEDILERINYLSKLDAKMIIKIKEKGKSKDDYSLTAKIYKISEDNKILINLVDEEIFDYEVKPSPSYVTLRRGGFYFRRSLLL